MQGLALVTFPAAGSIFTSRQGYALSPTQYGAMFLPQDGVAAFGVGPLQDATGVSLSAVYAAASAVAAMMAVVAFLLIRRPGVR